MPLARLNTTAWYFGATPWAALRGLYACWGRVYSAAALTNPTSSIEALSLPASRRRSGAAGGYRVSASHLPLYTSTVYMTSGHAHACVHMCMRWGAIEHSTV